MQSTWRHTSSDDLRTSNVQFFIWCKTGVLNDPHLQIISASPMKLYYTIITLTFSSMFNYFSQNLQSTLTMNIHKSTTGGDLLIPSWPTNNGMTYLPSVWPSDLSVWATDLVVWTRVFLSCKKHLHVTYWPSGDLLTPSWPTNTGVSYWPHVWPSDPSVWATDLVVWMGVFLSCN